VLAPTRTDEKHLQGRAESTDRVCRRRFARITSRMSQNDPGLELHEWETRWSELEPMLEEDPAGALSEACDFVEQVLVESDVAVEGIDGENDELLAGYRAARETANRVEQGADVDPGDVGAAIENLRALYGTLRARPG
jgi:hypothetical protein